MSKDGLTRKQRTLRRVYPEVGAGGFSQVDGTVDFYTRIAALLDPAMTVLDFGAGRGAAEGDSLPFRRQLVQLKGRVKTVVGVDVDPVVLTNPLLDEAHVVAAGSALPFADETFDLIYSDWVLEHVDEPSSFAGEIKRLLKPGGWFCARTPNRWGMTAVGSSLIPNRLHAKALSILQPGRRDIDVFPTRYRLNTRAQIDRHFPPGGWENYTYIHSPEPGYFLQSSLATQIAAGITKFLPASMGHNLHVFIRKSSLDSE